MKIFKHSCLALLAFSSLVFTTLAFAQMADIEYEWEEKRNTQGIVIQTSEVA
ncbi:MAG: ABC-type uncharacterized transport system permease subunit [Polaribacter sp.]|jgi:hypothetical protein